MLIRVVVRLFPQKSGNAVIYGIRAGSAAELIRIVPVRLIPGISNSTRTAHR